MLELRPRFAIVPGDLMFANTRWSSSQTAVVPLGERFGVPSGHTVATKPRRCSSTTRFMSAVRIPVCRSLAAGAMRPAPRFDRVLLINDQIELFAQRRTNEDSRK